MLDVCLLGTGGTMPLPNRWLTSLMLRYNGRCILVDAGEGTQIAAAKCGLSLNPIDIICITHFHADHVMGIIGVLLSMGKMERSEPVTIIGPKGTGRVINSLRCAAPVLPFELRFIEVSEKVEQFDLVGIKITSFSVYHEGNCLGYSFEIPRAGKFSPEKARENDVPMKLWSKLQKGAVIEQDGRVFTPDLILGEPRKGIKLTYCTDTRPTKLIEECAAGSDLFICEGMYADREFSQKAVQKKHMMFHEAAQLALNARVGELWLTHFSPSLRNPQDYVEETRKIFPNTFAGEDGKKTVISFED